MMYDGFERRRRKNVPPRSPVAMLSVRQIAKRYGFHENTVRKWVREDGLQHVHYGPGDKIYVAEGDVEEFVHRFYDY